MKKNIFVLCAENACYNLIKPELYSNINFTFITDSILLVEKIKAKQPFLFFVHTSFTEQYGNIQLIKLNQTYFSKRTVFLYEDIEKIKNLIKEFDYFNFFNVNLDSELIIHYQIKNYIELFMERENLLNENEELEKLQNSYELIGNMQNRELDELFYESILMLANVAEAKDDVTGSHVVRIQHYVYELCRESGISPKMCEYYSRCSILHDIGKLKIPDQILKKPAKLTPEEYDYMKKHTIYAHDLLSRHPYFDEARLIALYHHEKWNGNGYPTGLKNVNIPLTARIASIADVFDALITARPYKIAWDYDDAVQFILTQKGISFDPELVEVFLKLNNKSIIQDILNQFG